MADHAFPNHAAPLRDELRLENLLDRLDEYIARGLEAGELVTFVINGVQYVGTPFKL
jgi:hypothetical protein